MQNIAELKNKVSELKSSLDSLNGKISFIKESIEKNSVMKSNLENNKLQYTKAVELLSLVQKITREKTKDEFETIVTYALQSIFQENHQCVFEFGKRGNLPELDIEIKKSGHEEPISIVDGNGGGVVDLVALALRLVLLEISKNKGFLVLDEVFKHLSEEGPNNAHYRVAAFQFLKDINSKLNRQIIFVTHIPEFIEAADHKIKIGE